MHPGLVELALQAEIAGGQVRSGQWAVGSGWWVVGSGKPKVSIPVWEERTFPARRAAVAWLRIEILLELYWFK